QPEHRKAVSHADAQMNAERRRRHQPAIEACFGDDPFAIEDAGPGDARRYGAIECRCHRFPLKDCAFVEWRWVVLGGESVGARRWNQSRDPYGPIEKTNIAIAKGNTHRSKRASARGSTLNRPAMARGVSPRQPALRSGVSSACGPAPRGRWCGSPPV